MKRATTPLSRTKRAVGALGLTATIAGIGVVGLAQPAGAIVTVSSSGSTMTANVTGSGAIPITCAAGVVSIGGKASAPTVSCAALSKVAINGDSGGQTIDGAELESGVFAAKPSLVAKLGDGVDTVTPTSRADDIDLGPGNDVLYLVDGPVDTLLDGGADQDYIRLNGSDGVDDEFNVSSAGTIAKIQHAVGGILRETNAKNFDRIEAGTYGGDDDIDFSGITAASTLKSGGIYAGEGNDTLRAPQFNGSLDPGPGTNQVYGGAANDNTFSSGNGDVIRTGGGSNRIYDRTSGRSGRTVADSMGVSNWYFFEGNFGDTTTRIRPGSAGSAVVTNSLTRTGQQLLPGTFKNVSAQFGSNAAGSARGLVDAFVLDASRKVYATGDSAKDDLIDLTIPAGAWTTMGTPQTGMYVTPTNLTYAEVHLEKFGAASIHGPWTNKNNGFVHRVTRDLMFRFETQSQIALFGGALAGGDTTRDALVGMLMNSDEYRGLDVDRTFTRYLRRSVDPSGRTYWINSIKNGKALWRFRAQLFGSNEYFTKAGGTNASYLDRVYFDVLGRLPDPSGRTYWVNKLNKGADRGAVALQFIKAPEFRRFVVDDQFLRLLDRKPTAQEQTTWVETLRTSATGEQQLIAYLAGTAEYFNRS